MASWRRKYRQPTQKSESKDIRSSRSISWLEDKKKEYQEIIYDSKKRHDVYQQNFEAYKLEQKLLPIRLDELKKREEQIIKIENEINEHRQKKPSLILSLISPKVKKQWEDQFGPLWRSYYEAKKNARELHPDPNYSLKVKWAKAENEIHTAYCADQLKRIEQIEKRIATLKRLELNKQEKRDLIAKAKGNARIAAQSVKANLNKTRTCPYCTEEIGGDPHADHIIPLAAGGSSFETNMVYVCASCNLSKGSLTLLEFCENKGWDFMELVSRLRKLGKRI